MFITAHTVIITWNADHLLFHTVRFSRAVSVAAILKTDNKSSSFYLQFSLSLPLHTHTHTRTQIHCTLTQKKGPFLFLHSSELKGRATAELRSHMATVRHTALLVKALSAGQAMPGVICWKQTKKLSSPFKQELPGKLLNVVDTTVGGELDLL